jgi:hypothetical protein
MKAAKSLAQTAVLLLAALISGTAWAQTSNGTLAGSVVDPSGAAVTQAGISAVSSQYGQPHETRTDSAGTYRLESLQPGIYAVTITAPGFETVTVTDVVVSGSLTTTINGKLILAPTQQTIEVQANAGQAIDTQSGQLGENISREEVAELPYSSLNPAALAMTLPGVQDSPIGNGAIPLGAETEGISFSVNGARPRANNFLVDGQDDNDYGVTGQAYQPINYGAIQEVTVLTNSYSAEYGRGGGSVTNYIFKSGTNNFHGDLWEINRNSALAAIPAQDEIASTVTKNPYDNENTFGFDAGGPVKKDKLFVFGAAQWERERLAATGPVFDLPTVAGIATLKDDFPSNANVNLFLNAIGSLVSPGTTGLKSIATGANGACPCVNIAEFQVQNVRTNFNDYDWNYRMDWHITNNDILTGSVIRDNHTLSPDNFANPGALPNFQTEQAGPSEIFRGQWARTISSALANELRLSYTSIDIGFALTPATAAGSLANIPYIKFGDDIDFPSIGVNGEFPQGRNHKAWQIQEALSYSTGRHTIKAGVDITVLSLNDTLALNTRGSIFYNSGGGYTSIGNFIGDFTGQNPGTISKGFGNPSLQTGANMFAPYIEDTWRIKYNLTLNMGLRYEYWGALANGLAFPAFNTNAGVGLPNATNPLYATDPAMFDSLYSFKQIPNKRNFAPRFGLAYTPHWGRFPFGDGKTVLRAGYGIFYDGLFTTITDESAGSQPNTFGGTLPAQVNRGTGAASTFPGIGPTLDSTLFVQTMASNLQNPMTQQWNADVQRELPLGLVLTLAYVGTRGEHLFASQDFNPQVDYSYINPNFGEIEVRTNAGDSWYNAGQAEVERKIRSLVLRAAYTYSKFLDDVSDTETTTGTSPFSQVLSNQHSDWGPSAYDRRHRFTLGYVWQAPYFHHQALLRALTDGWEWSGIATIESGTPNTVSTGFDNIGNGHTNGRPDLANASAPFNSLGIAAQFPFIGGLPGTYINSTCLFYTAGPCNPEPLNTFHFVIPYLQPGDVSRNSIYGPGQIYFDTAIQRDFPIHFWKVENQKLSFRAELFNAFNHPNLFTPSYAMTSLDFNNTSITISGGRQIKLWLKYTF